MYVCMYVCIYLLCVLLESSRNFELCPLIGVILIKAHHTVSTV